MAPLHINMRTWQKFLDERLLENTGWKLYHGSNSEQFIGKIKVNERDSGWFGAGFYLTAYPSYAQRWGKFIYEISVPPSKFAEVITDNNYSKIEFVGDAQKADLQAGGTEAWINNETQWSQTFTKVLQQMGYDGVRVHVGNYKDLEVLIFNPSKLVVIGTFVA